MCICTRASMHAYVRTCVERCRLFGFCLFMGACVSIRACVRACMHACVSLYVSAWLYAYVSALCVGVCLFMRKNNNHSAANAYMPTCEWAVCKYCTLTV